MLVVEFLISDSGSQVAAFMLPMIIMAGIMFLMMMLFAKKPNTGTMIDMNTPSIQLTRGGIIPIVHGFRRVGATFAWVGNRYTVEEPVDSVGKSIAEGTLVESKSGPVPIESLKPGDKIWTRNKKGKRKLGRIKSISDRMSDDIVRIQHVGESVAFGEKKRVIDVTSDHLMWVMGPRPEKRWVQAKDIHPGDEFELFSGKKSTVQSVGLIKTEKRVLCPRMSRFSSKNFFAGDICVHNIDDVEITQTAYFESSWHIVACGPVSMINGIWENGKKVHGPVFSEQVPSGSTVSIGENSSFKVYWGFSDSHNSSGNCSGDPPANEDPILKNFCPTGGEDKQSCWPNVCSVVWQTRRLGVYPRWPQVEYDIYSEASGGAQSYECGFDIDDSGYSDAGCDCDNGPDDCVCWGVNPVVSLFKILTGPYPTGLSIPGERMDHYLFREAAEHIRSKEGWNSNVLIQAGHEYHRVVAELLSDMGAVLIEREGLIGPKIIRKDMASDEPVPLLTGDLLRPPLDEIARSHISSMNESIQFKFHQRSLNYRQNTIDIDNQESVAEGEYRRKTTSAEMATVTSWYSATTVANRRSYESLVASSTLSVNGDRGLRELRPGALVDVANVGKYRITSMTPDFDSIGVKLDLTLDPYSVGEITPWTPDDSTPEPPVYLAEPDISQDFFAIDLSASVGDPGDGWYGVLPFVIRAHQSMTNHTVYWLNPDTGVPNAVGSALTSAGGVVIYRIQPDYPNAWDDNSHDSTITQPCLIGLYANGDQFNIPTEPSGSGDQYVIAAKVWTHGGSHCDCEDDAKINFELASVSHFEDLNENHGDLWTQGLHFYNQNVEAGLLPPDMRLVVPMSVSRGVAAGDALAGLDQSPTYHQGTIRSSLANPLNNDGDPTINEMGSRIYIQSVSRLFISSINLATDLVPLQDLDLETLWWLMSNMEDDYGRFKATPCFGTDCVPISDVAYSAPSQCGDEPYGTMCLVGDSGDTFPCSDIENRTHAGEGGGFFSEHELHLAFGDGDHRAFGGGNFPPSNGMISGMRVGGLHGDYGSSTGVNVPTNGGLVEHTASSSTVDIPDQGFMGMLDGYYRIPQGDHTTTSSSAPTPQMIGIQWSYKDPSKGKGVFGGGGTDVHIPSDVYFKVRLQGAGILENDVRRLPHIGEIPDYSTSFNEWTTWIDFEQWKLGSSQFDHRMGMTSIVTFALPRAREKTLLARYLNTNETQAVSVMIGLGGRSRVADVAAVKQPRCRFLIEYYRKGRVVGTSTAYIRAVGTDGATNYPSDSWW